MIAIVVGAVTLIAGAFYAVVNVQGERIKETREDFTSRVETLDEHIGTRMTEQTARLEQGIDALGDRLEPKIDALSERLDRVEGDLRPAP